MCRIPQKGFYLYLRTEDILHFPPNFMRVSVVVCYACFCGCLLLFLFTSFILVAGFLSLSVFCGVFYYFTTRCESNVNQNRCEAKHTQKK